MRRKYDSIDDLLRETAARKARAAKARAAGKRSGAEPSKNVYLECCARICAGFADEGYRYAKSGPHMSRKAGDFKFTVSFRTSFDNVPGKQVHLGLSARASSARLAKWRATQEQPARSDSFIAGGNSNAFVEEAIPVEWELADPAAREETCADAADYIRTHILTWFALFEDPDTLVTRLGQEQVRVFEWAQLANVVEFAMCFGDLERAIQVFQRLVRERAAKEDEQAELRELVERYRREGLPSSVHGRYTEQLGRLVITHRLPLPW